MELIASYCLTEPGAGSDAAALHTKPSGTATAKPTASNSSSLGAGVSGRLRGDGPHRCRRTQGISAFIVERTLLVVSVPTREDGLERPTHRTGYPRKGVRVPADAMLGGPEAEGAASASRWARPQRQPGSNIAACSLGGARPPTTRRPRIVDRHAFGGALIIDRTIQFALAEMATALEPHAADAGGPPVHWTAIARQGDAVRDGQALRHRLLLRRGRPGTATAGRLRLALREVRPGRSSRDLRVHRILEGHQRNHACGDRPL